MNDRTRAGNATAGLLAALTAILPIAVHAAGDTATTAAERALTQRAFGTVAVSRHDATGKLRFVRIVGKGDLQPGLAYASRATKADAFLAEQGAAFGIDDPSAQLELVDERTDALGTSTRSYVQKHQGVPVFGTMLRVGANESGELRSVNGTIVPDIRLDTKPAVTTMTAAAAAIERVLAAQAPRARGILEATGTRLYVWRDGLLRGTPGSDRLAWEITVSDGAGVREFVYVDAHSGKIIQQITGIHDIDRRIYDGGFNTGSLVWTEGNTTPFGDIDVDNLIDFAADTYNLYSGLTGGSFLSWNGTDATMHSVNNDPTIGCPNAHWTGSFTGFCAGVTSDDIVAHEWGHAYTQSTHGLIYLFQSGALNESYSDIFGETVDLLNGAGTDAPGAVRTTGQCTAFGGSLPPQLEVNAPASLAGFYNVGGAAFNPASASVTGPVVLVSDGTAQASEGCNALVNGAALSGNIALVDRGNCPFTQKVINAQNAGAIGVIVINNDGDGVMVMGGSSAGIGVPSVFVGQSNGGMLKTALGSLNATITLPSGSTVNSVRWLMGEDSGGFGGAIRDMWSPNCFGDPGRVSDPVYYCGADDGGGVHTNSAVPNHGYALLVDGGTYNGISVTGIGMTKAAAIYWRASDVYQVPSSGFADHADALEASCADLVGQTLYQVGTASPLPVVSGQVIGAADCAAVDDMIAAVELRSPPTQCNYQPLLAPGAPALCASGQSATDFGGSTFEAGLGSWTVGMRAVAQPATFDTPDWFADATLPDGRAGTAAHVAPTALGNCTTDIEAGVLYLQSPVSVVPAGAAPRLTFTHWVATEADYDGGNVKISVNGSGYSVLPSSAFEFNAYNQTLVSSDNPLSGEQAWSGTDGGGFSGSWGQSVINLSGIASAGDSVRLRFEVGVDGCNAIGNGWYVDDVRLYSCSAAADSDGDGIGDALDNCTNVANADQRDTNGDGFGNICDADINNDNVINFGDLAMLKSVWLGSNPDADFNGDGLTNFGDLVLMKASFLDAPGPSGIAP